MEILDKLAKSKFRSRFKHNFRAISNEDKVGIVDKNENFTATTFDDKEIKINTEDLIKEKLSV